MLRSYVTRFVATLCLCLFPAVSIAADGELTQYELANGLKIYVYEKHNVPIAAVHVWYRTGSLNEHPGIRGISHLFEHMMFRGSEMFGPEEHNRKIKEMGGWANAGTAQDYTNYVQTIPVSGIELVLQMESDRMAHLKLEDGILQTERNVVKEEFLLSENNPLYKLFLDFGRIMFGSHPYSWTPLGVKTDLDSIRVEDCVNYYKARYAPNNAALIVVGDVSPDDVRRMAERHFGPIPAFPDIEPDPPLPIRTGTGPVELRAGIPIRASGVAYWLPPAGHEDQMALEVLERLLGPHLEDVLTRKDKSCVESVAWPLRQKQVSVLLFAGVHFPNVSADRVCTRIEEEIKSYLANHITREELERVRNQILLEEISNRYSVSGLAYAIGTALFLEGDLDRFSRRLDQMSALTLEDLVAVGNRYFTKENRVIVLVEPEHSSKLLYVVGWLKSLFHL
jgi:zinc protease